MKPDFALSLSLDGIRLLCRVPDGWHLLGDVPLDHADLDAALKDLRQRGETQAGGPALCKLILPGDQIKYLSITTGTDDLEAAVRRALVGATPYDLDDLAYDFVETNDSVQIAAVARDTLGEAEEFAARHGFDAVSFVAAPEAAEFQAEPFFGPTKAAPALIGDTAEIEPDDLPVIQTSEGALPEPEMEAEVEAQAEAEIDTPADPIQPALPLDAPDLPVAENQPDTPDTPNTQGDDSAAAPAFATSRSLVAERTAGASNAKLPGVDRGIKDAAAAAPQKPTEDASALAQQDTRFDPASLLASLKPAPVVAPAEQPAPPPRPVAKPAVANKPAGTAPARAAPEKPSPLAAEPTQRGRPRYLGAILVAILIVFLAGVAVWASIFTEDGLAGWFSSGEDVEQIAFLPDPDADLGLTVLEPTAPDTITDSAEVEALDGNEGVIEAPAANDTAFVALDPVIDAALPIVSGDTFYAATGIWAIAPEQPLSPAEEISESIYLASFEPWQITHDAVALPTAASFGEDASLGAQSNPVPHGIEIELDARGLVVATPEGALSPEGILVFAGRPAALPEKWPDRSLEVTQLESDAAEVGRAAIANLRPTLRPEGLVEGNERATLGGSTRSELAQFRPRARPEQAVEIASVNTGAINDALENAIDSASDLAISASLKPRARPQNFASKVTAARQQLASVAVPQTEVLAPTLPTTASVARSATEKNVLNLRKINLIGVYGSAADRRALVRLSSGRYKKVKVGDRIDGGRVSAISSSELRYVKGSRDIVLKMPKG
ncbi:hypothetical protein N6L24_15220 [Cognatishimia sp. SS12]|uniref:hypothetical protein n=1 Tax=Cognatishimia sp. SS12 TaxID=2979465 RepID=UPI0023310BAC|nr:hypothetical protein [Cognatishimia sp. SS12]MDC0739639.1 hypothetical protein [Cognatishimia sp. SS12]